MNKQLEEAIDREIYRILTECPASLYDRNRFVVDCTEGPAVAFKFIKTQDGNVVPAFNDQRDSGREALHGDIRNTPPGLEVLRGRLWSDLKVASFYQSERIVEKYRKEVEQFFKDLGEDINSYRWDFNDSSTSHGLVPWPFKGGYKVSGPAINIPPDIQRKINNLLPKFHLVAPGPEKDRLKAKIDALYKKAGLENQKELQAKAYRKAGAEKLSPYEKGGGTVAGYRGRLPAIAEEQLNENPDTCRDVKSGGIWTVYDDGPAVAFYCIADDVTGKYQWYYYRNDRGSAWHNSIVRRPTAEIPDPFDVGSDRYLRGRIWQDPKVCSFYANKDKFGPTEVKRVEELFDILGFDISEFRFEFNNSARTDGLQPWPFKKESAPEAPKLSPEEQKKIDDINKKIADLQATLHLKTGAEKEQVEKEIERLEKMAGRIGGVAARKAAYRKTGAEKIAPFEKGGGSLAGYRGRLPAIAEDTVRLYNKNLCPKLWTPEMTLNPEARETLLQIALDFYTDTELPGKIKDVQLLGSAANYNWTPASDLDVHILVDGSEVSVNPEEREKFFRSMVGKWNLEHDISVKGHPVELYLQDVNEKNAATAIYSLLQNRWVKEPSPERISVNQQEIQKQYTEWVMMIRKAIASKDEASLKKILEDLRDYRKAGLDASGEFSTQNLVFKILRARGFLEKVKDAHNKFYDQKHSVKDGFDPTSMGPNVAYGVNQNMDNGGFYRRMNDKMREMEEGIKMSDLKSRHPRFAVDTRNPELKRLTLDNLKSLRDKAARFYSAARDANDEEEMMRATQVWQMFNDEIKHRLAYVNKPVNETKTQAPIKSKYFTIFWNQPYVAKGVGLIMIGSNPPSQFADPNWFANLWHPWGVSKEQSEDWAINRAGGAFKAGFEEEGKHFESPEAMLAYLDKWWEKTQLKEGYGAGNPEEDRLNIHNTDGSVRRWQIRSKDAPKTPKMTKEVMDMVNEALDTVLPEVITEGELLLEHPLVKTLKKNKKPLTDEERKEVMRKGAVWHHGPKGEKTPAVWKSVVNGKTWYACNTHRAIQVKSTLKAAIRAFSFIKTTA